MPIFAAFIIISPLFLYDAAAMLRLMLRIFIFERHFSCRR